MGVVAAGSLEAQAGAVRFPSPNFINPRAGEKGWRLTDTCVEVVMLFDGLDDLNAAEANTAAVCDALSNSFFRPASPPSKADRILKIAEILHAHKPAVLIPASRCELCLTDAREIYTIATHPLVGGGA